MMRTFLQPPSSRSLENNTTVEVFQKYVVYGIEHILGDLAVLEERKNGRHLRRFDESRVLCQIQSKLNGVLVS